MLSSLLLALFGVVLGAAFCFVGYRFFLVMLPIWGFFGGLWLGATGVSLLLGTGFLATTTGLIVGFVVGVLGALLSYLFYTVGVAIVAASIGGAIGSGFMGLLGFDPGLLTGVVAIACALVAVVLVLALNLQKYVIIILTAVVGAFLMVLAVSLLLGQVNIAEVQSGVNVIKAVFQASWFWGLVGLVLAVVGSVVQIRANRDYVFRKEMYVEGWG